MDDTQYSIPFNKPFLAGKELYYIAQSVLSGKISGDGVFTKKCHKLMEQKLQANRVFLTTSCTDALEMSAILCGIGEGDEVIVPSYTFVTTANAFVMRGAKPVFIDIREDTLNMNETLIEAAITPATKCIVPVHYAGVGCEMDTIMSIARKHNLYVVEDAAQAVSARYKGRYLGTIGDFGTFSFHETKNFICGEGGALLVNNESFVQRAEIIREKGTNRTQFFKGMVDKYSWIDIGSSYLPSEVLAAFLYAQLENIDTINARRKQIYETYVDQLQYLEEKGIARLPRIPQDCDSNYHMFYLILDDPQTRDNLMQYLRTKGILSVFHYLPLHTSEFCKSKGWDYGSLPVTDHISPRLLRLPFYYELSSDDQKKVIDEIKQFFISVTTTV